MIVKVGFTGTRRGMTPMQAAAVSGILLRISTLCYNKPQFHHGACIGADEEAARIAKNAGFATIAHPGDDPRFRTEFVSDWTLEEKDNILRNKNIVKLVDSMIATPSGTDEIRRGSGTWQVIGYTRMLYKPLYFVTPLGEVLKERFD